MVISGNLTKHTESVHALEIRGDETVLITGSFIMAEDALKWLKRTSAGF